VVEKNSIDSMVIKKYKAYNEENSTRYSISLLRPEGDLMFYITLRDQVAKHLFITGLNEGDVMYFSLPVRVLSVTGVSIK